MNSYTIILLISLFFMSSNSQWPWQHPPPPQQFSTVQEAINFGDCETTLVAGLSLQIIEQANVLEPNLFLNLNGIQYVSLSSEAAAVPYLQSAAYYAIMNVTKAEKQTMSISCALIGLPEQLMLYQWSQEWMCGNLGLELPQGQDNYNVGLGFDLANYQEWWTLGQNSYSLQKYGYQAPMYYYYQGNNANPNAESFLIKAFQILWNANNPPSSFLPENGIYNQQVSNALLNSPPKGWV